MFVSVVEGYRSQRMQFLSLFNNICPASCAENLDFIIGVMFLVIIGKYNKLRRMSLKSLEESFGLY